MNQIIYIESESVRHLMPKAENIMSDERLERFYTLKCESDKLDCLAVSVLLERALNGKINLYYKDENGCPKLRDGRFISISHSGGIACVAISDKEVGIDVQSPGKRNYLSIARVAYHEQEIERLKTSTDIKTDFFNLWCLKESYMKARGLGFALPSKSYYFQLEEDNITLHSDDADKWKFTLLKLDGLFAAVCAKSQEEFAIEKLYLP